MRATVEINEPGRGPRIRITECGAGSKHRARNEANEDIKSTWWLRQDGRCVQFWPCEGGRLRQHTHPAPEVRILRVH